MNRKFAGLSLLLCLVVPVLALFIWTEYQKHDLRRAVKWRMAVDLDKEDLVLLKFTYEDADSHLHWKHPKEFEFQGSMYDIIRKELHGDTTYYYCWLDKEETTLNQRLDELVALAFGKDPKQKENKEKLSFFYKNWFHKPSYESERTFYKTVPFYSTISENYFSLHLPPPVLPPPVS